MFFTKVEDAPFTPSSVTKEPVQLWKNPRCLISKLSQSFVALCPNLFVLDANDNMLFSNQADQGCVEPE